MNIIQMIDQVAFLNDREKSARFLDDSYMKAINESIIMILEDRLEPIKKMKRYSFELVQRVRDELYSLIPPTLSIVPAGNTLAYPADYNYFLKLECVIDGATTLCRPTSYGESGTLPENPFKRPANNKTYFDQYNAGFLIYRAATGSFTSGKLDYVKNPDTVSIGTDANKIAAGGAVLIIGSTYIVYEEAVHAGTTYSEGATFVASATSLTSGIVILYSLVTNCNLPVKIHQEICRLASAIMNGTVEDYNKKQDLKADSADS